MTALQKEATHKRHNLSSWFTHLIMYLLEGIAVAILLYHLLKIAARIIFPTIIGK